METKILTSILLVLFFGTMIYTGIYCRKHATDVNGFVLGGLILVPIVSLFTPKCDKKTVDDIFVCYDAEVSVKATEALGK